ncbi:hypothetical protein SFRURICE_019000 [Spodoptera frugiperda]|uniref:SFRICE_022142 n=1 Tax=Spodoptera frugiperda TaxID=7108 RepID=A0A2H1VVB1_SPOFR|nr:hypothetical protein SFRURICE_019000 [Spodoptera frugiperda]
MEFLARSSIKREMALYSNYVSFSLQKLQMCGTEEEMREVAGRICRNYLHGAWKTVDPKDLSFRRISGGLSNFLYYIALPDDVSKWGGYQKRESSPETDPETCDNRNMRRALVKSTSFSIEEPRKVLLRIYGQVHGERAMDAIVTESVIFTLLSERRLGPKLHGVFSGGRIEQYIPARSLLTKELADPALSMKIAEKMAAIHSMEVPLNKEPNWIWKTMYKWLKTVKEERLNNTAQGKNEQEQRIIQQLKNTDLEKEIEWLKKFLATVDSPVVFCHNDMQEGNILLVEDAQAAADDDVSPIYVQTFDSDEARSAKNGLDKDNFFEDANTSDTVISHMSDLGEPKLVLIDFEYCAYNHRGFDIANHFQEWAFDYTNPEHPFYYEHQDSTPSLEQKEIFIREYLKHYQANVSDRTEVSLDDVNKLLDEVEAFALASHLFWALWSIVNASKSQIPFGYWEYAVSRLETYLRLKLEVIKKDKYGLPQKRKICEVDI